MVEQGAAERLSRRSAAKMDVRRCAWKAAGRSVAHSIVPSCTLGDHASPLRGGALCAVWETWTCGELEEQSGSGGMGGGWRGEL